MQRCQKAPYCRDSSVRARPHQGAVEIHLSPPDELCNQLGAACRFLGLLHKYVQIVWGCPSRHLPNVQRRVSWYVVCEDLSLKWWDWIYHIIFPPYKVTAHPSHPPGTWLEGFAESHPRSCAPVAHNKILQDPRQLSLPGISCFRFMRAHAWRRA